MHETEAHIVPQKNIKFVSYQSLFLNNNLKVREDRIMEKIQQKLLYKNGILCQMETETRSFFLFLKKIYIKLDFVVQSWDLMVFKTFMSFIESRKLNLSRLYV